MTEQYISTSVAETHHIAQALLQSSPDPIVIVLHGDLGCGKTCFVQGLAAAMGIHEPITSPTFTLVNEYRGSRALVHIDLYRIHDQKEMLALGLLEFMDHRGVTAIEWGERAGELIPDSAIHVTLRERDDPGERDILIESSP